MKKNVRARLGMTESCNTRAQAPWESIKFTWAVSEREDDGIHFWYTVLRKLHFLVLEPIYLLGIIKIKGLS